VAQPFPGVYDRDGDRERATDRPARPGPTRPDVRHGARMGARDSTCWTLLRDAAAGGEASRAEFAARYAPAVRAYLAARWRGSKLLRELDDTIQDVFIECLRDGGLLDRARADRPGGFRAFFYGAV